MTVEVYTAPSTEPISLTEAKAFLRVTNTSEDTLITLLIQTARLVTEELTGRALVDQTLKQYLDTFPSGRQIELERPPLESVSQIQYYDSGGALQTLSSAAYTVDIKKDPGIVELNPDQSWPSTQSRTGAVIITFKAGYTGSAGTIPADLLLLQRILVTHWFENRGIVNIGNLVNELPYSFKMLTDSKKVWSA